MNDRKNNDRCISRRAVLTGSVLALGAVAGAGVFSRAAAEQKFSQNAAQYQATPKGDQHCGSCSKFQPPNACKIIEGNISPSGWCKLFAAKT